MQKVLKIEGMTCGHCSGRVQRALEQSAGVQKAEVALKKGEAYVWGEQLEAETLTQAVEEAGYKVLSVTDKKPRFKLFKGNRP